jgi:hypothetical protein
VIVVSGMRIINALLSVLILILAIVGFSYLGSAASVNKVSSDLLSMFDEEDMVLVDVYMRGFFEKDYVSEDEFNLLTSRYGDKVSKELYPIGFVAELSEREVMRLARNDDIMFLEPSYTYSVALEDSVQIIEADRVWPMDVEGVNLDGAGESVCIIGTGIDFTHPDLSAKNIVGNNLNCLEGLCFVDPTETDLNGHETHVAGIVGANGGVSGVAPGADLIGLKVWPGDFGSGNIGIEIINAITWCVDNKDIYDISVISMSLGTDNLYQTHCDSTPLIFPINDAVSAGMSVVAATANDGSSTSIARPACISNVIPVGATNKDDTLASYSNYNDLVKLFAPGSIITSTCIPDDDLDGDGYCVKTGTSMSTPMVSGAIALLNQANRLTGGSMTPMETETLLFDEGEAIVDLPFDMWRRINVYNSMITIVPPPLMCVADITMDGEVNVQDLVEVILQWGNAGGSADVNMDGEVNVGDLVEVVLAWGLCEGEGTQSVEVPDDVLEMIREFDYRAYREVMRALN